MACHVVVTSHWSKWDDLWHTLRVLPLDHCESRELIEAISGEYDLRDHVAGLVRAGDSPFSSYPLHGAC